MIFFALLPFSTKCKNKLSHELPDGDIKVAYAERFEVFVKQNKKVDSTPCGMLPTFHLIVISHISFRS